MASEIPGHVSTTIALRQQRVTPLDFLNKQSVNPGNSDLSITELTDMALVQLFAKKNRTSELAGKLGISEQAGLSTVTAEFTAMPLSPGQWMLSATSGADGSFCHGLREQVGELGYVSEQSHGRIIIRVSGQEARTLLQKGCRLDLHPRVARAGYCAQTPIAQVGVLLHQVDDTPSYDLHVYSGFAQSFWQWLTESAAQIGYTAN